MKLWDKGTTVNQLVENFTVGRDRELDVFLACSDVLGTIAHINMLESIGLLEKNELQLLVPELVNIYREAEMGNFNIENGIEDVHSQVELLLTQKLGDAGKKVHSGRSRNDQVLVDIRIFARFQIKEIVEATQLLFCTLQNQSNKYKDVLIPGYTHLQVAMPSSFGLWFGAYAESLVDDLQILQAAYKITNQNPLGSAAGYGSSFPINRTMTTLLLGFDDLSYNVVYAQMGRGKTEKTIAFALSSIGATIARMSMDICLMMSQNFGFVTLPDELTTGSSIMPHKKNPDVFELLRAKGNRLQALPNEIAMITTNLPSGYHRDMQLLKECLFPAFEDMKAMLAIANFMLDKLIVKNVIAEDRYKYAFSVEELNKLVLSGVPMRDAYKEIGQQIHDGTYKPDIIVNHSHEGSIGNLCNDKIKAKMNKVLAGFEFEKVEIALNKLLQA